MGLLATFAMPTFTFRFIILILPLIHPFYGILVLEGFDISFLVMSILVCFVYFVTFHVWIHFSDAFFVHPCCVINMH